MVLLAVVTDKRTRASSTRNRGRFRIQSEPAIDGVPLCQYDFGALS